jgi:site-specific DNA recombinase
MHKLSWQYASQILQFADTGKRPEWGPDRRKSGRGNPAKYKEISNEVVRLRDEEKMSFAKIAAALSVGETTVHRAYDLLRPEEVREAAENGSSVQRGTFSLLGEGVHRQIREKLDAGEKVKTIAETLHCGVRTVYRVKQKMKAEASEEQAV